MHCRERIEKNSHAVEWMDRAGLFDFDSADAVLDFELGNDSESLVVLDDDDDEE